MRGMVIGTGLVLALLAGGWLGAETLASNRVAALIAQDPALQAASVSPLRDPRRIGVALSEPSWSDPALSISLPWARLFLSPASPLTARLDLPDGAAVTQGGQVMQLGLSVPVASMALSPLNGMAPNRLDVQARDLTLDGQPLGRGWDRMPRAPRAPPMTSIWGWPTCTSVDWRSWGWTPVRSPDRCRSRGRCGSGWTARPRSAATPRRRSSAGRPPVWTCAPTRSACASWVACRATTRAWPKGRWRCIPQTRMR